MFCTGDTLHRLNTARISRFSIKRDTLDEEKNQSKHEIGNILPRKIAGRVSQILGPGGFESR